MVRLSGYVKRGKVLWSQPLSLLLKRIFPVQFQAFRPLWKDAGSDAPQILLLQVPRPPTPHDLRSCFRKEARSLPAPCDWCCLHNFEAPSRPRMVRLPSGKGPLFREDMETLVSRMSAGLRSRLLSESFREKTNLLRWRFGQQEKKAARKVYLELAKAGRSTFFSRSAPPPDLLDLEGMPLSRPLRAGCRMARDRVRSLKKTCTQELEAFTRQEALEVITPLMAGIRWKYRKLPKVLVYLDEVEEDVLRNLHSFTLPLGEASPAKVREQVFSPYAVTVLLSSRSGKDRPVVRIGKETSLESLFGVFASAPGSADSFTGPARLEAGSLHEANGGFLVVEASWVLKQFHLWERVKSSLTERELKLSNASSSTGIFAQGNAIPEAIPFQSLAVITGTVAEHAVLSLVDPDLAHSSQGPWRHAAIDSGSRALWASPGKPRDISRGPVLLPSARKAVLLLCSRPQPSGQEYEDLLCKVLAVVQRAAAETGIRQLTDFHITRALMETHPEIAQPALPAEPIRQKIRRPAGDTGGPGIKKVTAPITLFSGKVMTYGKQT